MKKKSPGVEIILLTAHGNIPDGVQAIKNGAFDYITKGDDNNKIIPLISRAVEKARMNIRLDKLEKKMGLMYSFDSILGESKALKEAVSLARKVSVTDVPVLLTGERCLPSPYIIVVSVPGKTLWQLTALRLVKSCWRARCSGIRRVPLPVR